MQITHMRCDAAGGFGVAVLAAKSSINPGSVGAGPGYRTSQANATRALDGEAFDPEAIDLMQAALDEAWGSLGPLQRAFASRSILAERVLALAARGERDRARLCAHALGDVERRFGSGAFEWQIRK
jgi:hypothetical protein